VICIILNKYRTVKIKKIQRKYENARYCRKGRKIYSVSGVLAMKGLLFLLMIIWSAQISAYDELHLKRFKALNKCPGCDLSGASFIGANLRRANLNGADLRGANLTGANLFLANFSHANLAGADLRGAEAHYSIQGAYFVEANLSGANLAGFRAGISDFTGADLTNTNIEEGHFRDAIFCNTKTPWGIENIGCTDN